MKITITIEHIKTGRQMDTVWDAVDRADAEAQCRRFLARGWKIVA